MTPNGSDSVSEILILGTAISSKVADVASRISEARPDVSVVVGVPEVETWKFRAGEFEVLTLGEERLPLDSPDIRREIEERKFQTLVLPVGIPREPLLSAARFVWTMKDQRYDLSVAGIHFRSRTAIVMVLVLVSFFGWVPLSILQRVTFAVDGAGVVAGGLLARAWPFGKEANSSGEVCHVVPNLGTGGTQRQVVQYLMKAGPGPPLRLIALFDYNDRFVDDLDGVGVEVEVLSRRCRRSRVGRVMLRVFPNLTIMVALRSRLREIRPQTVVSWLFQANVIAAPAARLAGVPKFISSVRSMSRWKTWPEFRRWWYRRADRTAANLSDVIFANSQAAADDFVHWTGIGHGDICVVSNGLDIDAFCNAPVSDIRRIHGVDRDVPIILSVGRLSSEKDHITLLKACARLKPMAPGWHVMIVGHGKLESELRSLAENLELGSHVTFCGRVNQPQSYYADADLFVLTSRIEGLPNALIEAQAYGLAAVTTESGGAVEVVEDGITALTVPVGDDLKLAEAMKSLLSDREARNAMGGAAMQSMRRRFGIETMVASVNRLTGRAPLERS